MAVRYRQDRNRWQVYWKNPYTLKQESAFFATEMEAMKADDQVKFKLKWERESFARAPKENEAEVAVQDTSFEAVFYAYLKEKQMEDSSIVTMVQTLQTANEVLGRKKIECVTKEDIALVLHKIMGTKNKATTIKYKMSVLKTIFIWARKRGYLETIPVWPESPSGRPEHFIPPTQDEIEKMLEAAPSHVQRVIVLGSKIGMRVGPSELFKLRWENVDLEAGLIRVQAAKKNKKEPWREVPLKKSLIEIIQKWKEYDEERNEEYVVNYAGQPVRSIDRAWRNMLARAGIKRRIRPYDLRHEFATELIANGADIGTVAKLMGHTDTTMVLRFYQHVTTKQKTEAIENLPELPQYAQSSMSRVRKQIKTKEKQ